MNNKTINQNELEVVKQMEVEYDGFVYKGLDLVYQMALGMGQGNYTLYNLATGGIGKQSPNGQLLAKLGVE